MFRSMELLSISIEEITERYNKLKKDGSMKRYAKTALWITFGLLFGLTIVKVSTLMYEIYSFMHS